MCPLAPLDVLIKLRCTACTAGTRKRVMVCLIATSLLSATLSSLYLSPYTPTAPKRAIISHIIHSSPADSSHTSTPGEANVHVTVGLRT